MPNIKIFHRKLIDNPNPSFLTRVFLFILKIVSHLYGFLSNTRIYLYKKNILPSYSADVPVISIGNITAGGTGKTPLCLEIIAQCIKENIIIGLVARGYGKDEEKIYLSHYPNLDYSFQPDRLKACQEVLKKNSKIQLILSDDSFQHLRLKRALDIVLINATCPFGYDYYLPRGLLRESIKALNRAQIIVITHASSINNAKLNEIKEKITTTKSSSCPILFAEHQSIGFQDPNERLITIQEFKNLNLQKKALLCGIANPNSFENSLQKIGVFAQEKFFFDDHYQYSSQDFDLIQRKQNNFDCIITTEKDIVKIPQTTRKILNVFTLVIQFKISEPSLILEKIKSLL